MHPWRERLDRWLGPLALKSPISANNITLLAFFLNLVAAAMLAYAAREPLAWLLAPVIAALAGLLDAFDGIVARRRGTASAWGDFLDHTLDRASDAALLIGWSLGAGLRDWIALSAVALVLFVGYVGTQIETSFGIRSHAGPGRGEYVLAMVILPLTAWILSGAGLLHVLYAGFTVPEWLTIALIFAMAVTLLGRFRKAYILSVGSKA